MYRNAQPIRAEDAFAEQSEATELSQAAFLLASALLLDGRIDLVDTAAGFALPDATALQAKERPSLDHVLASLDIDLPSHQAQQRSPEILRTRGRELARRTVQDGDPLSLRALIEAGTHSERPVVRAAAAAAALLVSTEPRPDIENILAREVNSGDDLTRDIAATALARVAPDHEALRTLLSDDGPAGASSTPTRTALITHGTWGAGGTWWKPGGDFYNYLAALPNIHLHHSSFGWSGSYSDAARQLAAVQLIDFVGTQAISDTGVFAHSHGGTVANLATQRGLDLDLLVLLAWPVHPLWFPDFTRVNRILSLRVNFDLVIFADGGGQKFKPPAAHAAKVGEHVHGWFDHSDTHEPAYWEDHHLATLL